jgi:hypothetical protein
VWQIRPLQGGRHAVLLFSSIVSRICIAFVLLSRDCHFINYEMSSATFKEEREIVKLNHEIRVFWEAGPIKRMVCQCHAAEPPWKRPVKQTCGKWQPFVPVTFGYIVSAQIKMQLLGLTSISAASCHCYCSKIRTNSTVYGARCFRSAGQGTLHLLCNPEVHYCVHNSLPLVRILSQINPVRTFPPYFTRISSNVMSMSIFRCLLHFKESVPVRDPV